MNTKTVCDQLNISPKALRVYENLEIVVPERSDNNYRNYSENDLLKLRQVVLLKELGIPLEKVKKILSQVGGKEDVVQGLALQLSAVQNKIDELKNIKLTLKQSINEALNFPKDNNRNEYLSNINKCLNENQQNRIKWMDKWGFDSWAETYDKSVKDNSLDGLNLFEKYDDVLDTVVNKISSMNASKVIDFGCGTANIYKRLNPNVEYIGIDQSIGMLLQAKNKFTNINLRLGNFLDENIIDEDSKVDAVISTFAFHHLKKTEKEKAIKLLLKYLKANGKIIIADLMFLDENERIKQKQYFYNQNRKDLWEIIDDEYYTIIDKMKKYVEFLGCTFQFKHITNFTWVIEIINDKL